MQKNAPLMALVLAGPSALALDLGPSFNQQHRLNQPPLQVAEATTIATVSALAVGDFNCDGRSDLAVGSAETSFFGVSQAGAVALAFGDELSGLAPVGQAIRQGDAIASGVAESEDWFGYSLAAADFDLDGCTDLAIGIPREDTTNPVAEEAGQVAVLRGAAGGLTGTGRVYLPPAGASGDNGRVAGHMKGWSLATPRLTTASSRPFLVMGAPDRDAFLLPDAGGIAIRRSGSGLLDASVGFFDRGSIVGESPRWLDYFGSNMAFGRFNGDTLDDLVVAMRTDFGCSTVGLPSFCVSFTGSIGVFYGGASTNFLSDHIAKANPDIPGGFRSGEAFGAALAVGDFDGDGFDDLAIGAPATRNAAIPGEVTILYGSGSGLRGALPRARTFRAGSLPGIASSEDDDFGFALAAGDFNADGFDDLAIGSPGHDGGRGRVLVIHGSAQGLSTSRVTQLRNGLAGMPAAATNQSYGHTLVAGDFNRDGADDLAIAQDNPFAVNVVYASGPMSMSLLSQPNPSLVGANYRVTAVARRQDAGNALRARGSIVVSDGLGNSCSATLSSNGVGSCSLPGATAGVRTLTATYAGVIGFQPNTTTRQHEVVADIELVDEVYRDGFEP